MLLFVWYTLYTIHQCRLSFVALNASRKKCTGQQYISWNITTRKVIEYFWEWIYIEISLIWLHWYWCKKFAEWPYGTKARQPTLHYTLHMISSFWCTVYILRLYLILSHIWHSYVSITCTYIVFAIRSKSSFKKNSTNIGQNSLVFYSKSSRQKIPFVIPQSSLTHASAAFDYLSLVVILVVDT